MAKAYFTVASFNLRNLVSPNTPYYSSQGYSDEAYARKINWLAKHLFRMDADIVCVQEIFDEAAINDLVSQYHDLLGNDLTPRSARDANTRTISDFSRIPRARLTICNRVWQFCRVAAS